MRFATAILFLTLAFEILPARAQYGLEFTAQDTFKAVRPDSTAIFHVFIRNSGSVRDSFRIRWTGQDMPANWVPTFCDSMTCFDLPVNITLDPGEFLANAPHVAIIAFMDLGTGWVECQVRSWGDTTLHREIRFHCANNTGVEGGERVQGTRAQGIQVTPNPFSSYARIPGHEGESFVLYDVSGRKLGRCPGSRIGENLAPGVYFLNPVGTPTKLMRILKIR